MIEEYSDYRYIPDDRDMSSSSSLSVFTVGDKVKISAGSLSSSSMLLTQSKAVRLKARQENDETVYINHRHA